MAKETKIKITLVKSLIGRLPKHVATADALGLRKIHHSVEVIDNPSIRGMINRINYLVQVEEL